MDVVGHHCEAVELEAAFAAMLEEHCDEEFGVGCALEVAMSLEGQNSDGVGALLLPDCGHRGEHTLGAKAPFFLPGWRAKPEGLAYLEAFRASLECCFRAIGIHDSRFALVGRPSPGSPMNLQSELPSSCSRSFLIM